MCKIQHKGPADSKGTFKGTTTTNGIHCHGLDWRISPPFKQRKQVCTHGSMHANRIYFVHPNKIKKAEDVMKAYTDNICCVFRPSKKILTDNGTEFKNKLCSKECAQNIGPHPSTHPNVMEGLKAFTSF